MATASVTQLAEIKREAGADIGLNGLLSILMRRTYRGEPNCAGFGKLTDQELVTVANQARNIHTAALEGLNTVGTLVSCFNPECDALDHSAVGWLTGHLSDTVREMGNIEWEANRELANRGYDPFGLPLQRRAQA
ncbi:MAG TPA: hypothetical protein VJ862_13320 [Rhodanobacteraceae bacterium]|nr:hypothetical protein [Rhodanobacteraceae bacterium]